MPDVIKIRVVSSGKVETAWRDFDAHIRAHRAFSFFEESRSGIEILLAVKIADAQAVILHSDSERSGISSHLFSEFPDLTILTLYPSGKAVLEQCCPTERLIVKSDPKSLGDVLRHAVENPCSNGLRT